MINHTRKPIGFSYLFRRLRGTFRNMYLLMFLNGFILSSLIYFKTESRYEDSLFNSIKTYVDGHLSVKDDPDSIAIKAMDVCYHLMNNKGSIFSDGDFGPEAGIFHSTAFDLMTTWGACGSYSQVLARTLKTFDFSVRIAQMKAGGAFGAHNIVEVWLGDKWAVLDPTFNLHFARPDGRLASFADVHDNWNYYSKQVPPGYNPIYRYEDARYTNWHKVPLVFPAIRSILTLVIGPQQTEAFCIRTMFMNAYSIYFYIFLALYIPIILLTCKRLIQLKVFANPETPFTFRNLVKYSRLRYESIPFSH